MSLVLKLRKPKPAPRVLDRDSRSDPSLPEARNADLDLVRVLSGARCNIKLNQHEIEQLMSKLAHES
jgi:hypothetical protein